MERFPKMINNLVHSFQGKRVLITGGLGFIGSNLARRLAGMGAEVCLIDFLDSRYGGNMFNIAEFRDQVRVVVADIRDQILMTDLVRGQDFLFNLAGQISHLGSMQDPRTDLEINCSSVLSILELCRLHNPTLKIVYSSTRQIYGRPRYLPVDEKHPMEPIDFNGISKMAGGWYHILYNQVYGMRTTSLRLTNVYGPRMWAKDGRLSFIGLWFRQMVEGQELLIFGDGKQIRDFNHVEDVVDALLLSAANPCSDGQIYNLGGEQPITLLELADLMVEINGSGSYRLVEFPPERKIIDIGDYYGDYTKISNQLGWQPRIKLREGIAETLAYYRQHKKHYW
jgi:UDP-glucose 4-epimerase